MGKPAALAGKKPPTAGFASAVRKIVKKDTAFSGCAASDSFIGWDRHPRGIEPAISQVAPPVTFGQLSKPAASKMLRSKSAASITTSTERLPRDRGRGQAGRHSRYPHCGFRHPFDQVRQTIEIIPGHLRHLLTFEPEAGAPKPGSEAVAAYDRRWRRRRGGPASGASAKNGPRPDRVARAIEIAHGRIEPNVFATSPSKYSRAK